MVSISFKEFYKKDKELNDFINQKELILFFKKDKEIFGCTEDSRIVFAKLKNPDDEDMKNCRNEAKFQAYNLSKSSLNNSIETNFSFKDLKNIKVINQEDINKLLKNK